MKNLEQFFRDAASVGIIDFALRASIVDGERVTFYVHPHGKDGETLDFTVTGNVLTPPGEFSPLAGPKPDASITIDRFGDRFSAVTGPDERGMALGIAANPDHTAAQSLSSALDFAREQLMANVSGEAVTLCSDRRMILMSADNPAGRKLEDLLPQIAGEVEAKTLKIAADPRPVARRVAENNARIVKLLEEAETLQRASLEALASIGPDEGPLGAPRIGSAA
ncbi:hypothetical protein [Azospirillum sp. TSH58]|uniref:hypothetical protein n=1 Tax=Azospirillum sp. TSH58 TaxID=664962 RepID=UPI0013A5AC1F|nr:hypothetical protein [Azospirillum sp. TSH58]